MKTLFHGSSKIVDSPEFGKGNLRNDYGLGFYCAESLELAKEWACSNVFGGYANRYSIDLTGLLSLNLSAKEYNILNWISLLLNNRTFSVNNQIASEGKDYLIKKFEKLSFENAEQADGKIYFDKRNERDEKARQDYLKKERFGKMDSDEIFLIDILRRRMKQNDIRF
jgi:hypothetical protein